MHRGLRVLLLCCCLGLGCSGEPEVTPEEVTPEEVTPKEVTEVRHSLIWVCPQSKTSALARFKKLGTRKLYAAFEIILDDPREDQEIIGVFAILLGHEGDCSRFVKPAVDRLKHPNPSVRTVALMLLEKIGTNKEAPAVV